MKYRRKRKIWDRWEIEYFNKLHQKLLNRKKPNGYPLYANQEEAFWELNEAYRNVYGKERYSSYESFLASRTQWKKGK